MTNLFGGWFNPKPQNSPLTLKNQKLQQLKEYFPDLIEDSVDFNICYIPFGKDKKLALCLIMSPPFPNGPPTLKLINMQHPFADANGILLPDIQKDLRHWNGNDSHHFGRIIYEVIAELQRPLFGNGNGSYQHQHQQQHQMKPPEYSNTNTVKSSRTLLMEALELMSVDSLKELLNCPDRISEFGSELTIECPDEVNRKKEKNMIKKDIEIVRDNNISDQKEIDELTNELVMIRQEHLDLNEVLINKMNQQATAMQRYSYPVVHGILSNKAEHLEECSEEIANLVLKNQSINDDFILNYRKMREELAIIKKKMELCGT
jgi:hypothetical protein